MKTVKEITSILNDLILINNDRIEGYQKAREEAKDVDADLQRLFTKMEDESRGYLSELKSQVTALGEEPAEGTTNSGKLYRVWMDLKNSMSNDSHSILASCEFGEDAAQKAYKEALDTDNELPAEIWQLINNQKNGLKQSHDMIKEYRDMHETVS